MSEQPKKHCVVLLPLLTLCWFQHGLYYTKSELSFLDFELLFLLVWPRQQVDQNYSYLLFSATTLLRDLQLVYFEGRVLLM
jgi:hypothetical protein